MVQEEQFGRLLAKLVTKYPAVPTGELEEALRNAMRLSKPRTGPSSFVLMIVAMLLENHPGVSIHSRRTFSPFIVWLGFAIAGYLALAWWYSISG